MYVSGRVQGVFFRSYIQQLAWRHNVKGWVRNLRDGRVEAVVEAEKGDVNAVIEGCRRGPSHAAVRDVKVEWQDYNGEFQSFEIRYGY